MNDPHEKQVEVDAMAHEAAEATATDTAIDTAASDAQVPATQADDALAMVQVTAQIEHDEQQQEKTLRQAGIVLETALLCASAPMPLLELRKLFEVDGNQLTNEQIVQALEQLQQDIENAVASRPDLCTAAGARSFQRYLIGKVRDIRTVVDGADLDATSKAALAAALSSLYASSGTPEEKTLPLEPLGLGLEDLPAEDSNPIPAEAIPSQGTAPAPAPAPLSPPAWGTASPASGGIPATGFPSLPDLQTASDPSSAVEHPRHRQHPDPADSPPDPPVEDSADMATAATEVLLPSGETITAPSPELANVITAAVAGTPIAEAFSHQGITIPAPGSTVGEQIDPARLTAGDIGIFTDRHALSLGNGTALLDNEIAPVTAIGGAGFLGWQHPPKPEPATRPAVTTTP